MEEMFEEELCLLIFPCLCSGKGGWLAYWVLLPEL